MAEGRPTGGAGPSQVARAFLGLAFPYLLLAIPPRVEYTAPAILVGIVLYVSARIASLFEPATLRRGGGVGATIGEAILLCLALALGLTALVETGWVDIAIGTGTLIVVGYLLLHAIALPIATQVRERNLADAPARPRLRSFIYAGAFVTQEAIALACIALAAHGQVVARQGPWGLWDLLPILPLIMLVIFYGPVLKLEVAAHPRLSEEESLQAGIEGMAIQAGAILVAAFTGVAPWV